MEDLIELNSNELTKLNGGVVWIPLIIKGAKIAGATAAGYLGYEVTDGIVRGIAGGEYLPEPCR